MNYTTIFLSFNIFCITNNTSSIYNLNKSHIANTLYNTCNIFNANKKEHLP